MSVGRHTAAILAEAGYDFYDFNGGNIGYLPSMEDGGRPSGDAVVLDLGALRVMPATAAATGRLSQSVNVVKRILNFIRPTAKKTDEVDLENSMSAQDRLYGDLKLAFQAAIKGTEVEKKDFWCKCVQAKSAGRLVASWNNMPDSSDIPQIASRYEARLMRNGFPFKHDA